MINIREHTSLVMYKQNTFHRKKPQFSWQKESEPAGARDIEGPSSLLLEEAFGRAALLDGDRQEVGGHVRHQHLLHVAEGRPPRHVVQVHVQSGGGRPVWEVRLLHERRNGAATEDLAGVWLEFLGQWWVSGGLFSSVCVHEGPVRVQAAL